MQTQRFNGQVTGKITLFAGLLSRVIVRIVLLSQLRLTPSSKYQKNASQVAVIIRSEMDGPVSSSAGFWLPLCGLLVYSSFAGLPSIVRSKRLMIAFILRLLGPVMLCLRVLSLEESYVLFGPSQNSQHLSFSAFGTVAFKSCCIFFCGNKLSKAPLCKEQPYWKG